MLNGNKIDVVQPCPFESKEDILLDNLLRPTALYVEPVLKAAQAGLLKGASHITGGGWVENIPRSLPKGLSVKRHDNNVAIDPVFRWLARQNVSATHMIETFNCGIGMLMVAAPDNVEQVIDMTSDFGALLWGELIASDKHDFGDLDVLFR